LDAAFATWVAESRAAVFSREHVPTSAGFSAVVTRAVAALRTVTDLGTTCLSKAVVAARAVPLPLKAVVTARAVALPLPAHGLHARTLREVKILYGCWIFPSKGTDAVPDVAPDAAPDVPDACCGPVKELLTQIGKAERAGMLVLTERKAGEGEAGLRVILPGISLIGVLLVG